jgi:hypothetical protein
MFSARSSRNIKILNILKELQKALISDLIINVKYRSFRIILAEIESAWLAS